MRIHLATSFLAHSALASSLRGSDGVDEDSIIVPLGKYAGTVHGSEEHSGTSRASLHLKTTSTLDITFSSDLSVYGSAEPLEGACEDVDYVVSARTYPAFIVQVGSDNECIQALVEKWASQITTAVKPEGPPFNFWYSAGNEYLETGYSFGYSFVLTKVNEESTSTDDLEAGVELISLADVQVDATEDDDREDESIIEGDQSLVVGQNDDEENGDDGYASDQDEATENGLAVDDTPVPELVVVLVDTEVQGHNDDESSGEEERVDEEDSWNDFAQHEDANDEEDDERDDEEDDVEDEQDVDGGSVGEEDIVAYDEEGSNSGEEMRLEMDSDDEAPAENSEVDA